MRRGERTTSSPGGRGARRGSPCPRRGPAPPPRPPRRRGPPPAERGGAGGGAGTESGRLRAVTQGKTVAGRAARGPPPVPGRPAEGDRCQPSTRTAGAPDGGGRSKSKSMEMEPKGNQKELRSKSLRRHRHRRRRWGRTRAPSSCISARFFGVVPRQCPRAAAATCGGRAERALALRCTAAPRASPLHRIRRRAPGAALAAAGAAVRPGPTAAAGAGAGCGSGSSCAACAAAAGRGVGGRRTGAVGGWDAGGAVMGWGELGCSDGVGCGGGMERAGEARWSCRHHLGGLREGVEGGWPARRHLAQREAGQGLLPGGASSLNTTHSAPY
jgi:hypothetical protein